MSDSLTYHRSFDVVMHGYTTWRVAAVPAGLAIAAGLLRVLSTRVSPEERRRLRVYDLLTGGACVFLSVGTMATVLATWHEYADFRTRLQGGSVRLLTGTVNQFIPEGPGGHPRETFRINGIPFSYSSYEVTSAFHRTARCGGPMREGLHVRMADVDGAILRLDVAP